MYRPIFLVLMALIGVASLFAQEAAPQAPQAPLPVHFTLDRPGFVTLVVENEAGLRVRNLLAATWFEAGAQTVYWDGLGEGKAEATTGVPGYRIQREVVAPGGYRVRGIVRDAIGLEYQFTVLPNVAGTPWPTDAGAREGGWLGDHGNPTATLFIPAARAPGGGDQMLLANSVNEAAHGLAWVDLAGRKLAGQRHLGGTWTGATHLTADRGSAAHPAIYAYARMDWVSKTPDKTQLRLTGLTLDGEVTVSKIDIDNSWDGGNPGDIAVHNGILVASAFGPDRLMVFDVRGVTAEQPARLLGEFPLDKPHALAFEADGSLLAVSGDRLLRYPADTFPKALADPAAAAATVVIGQGLDEPRDLAVGADGAIYVAEWGHSHVVQVFDAAGTLQRRIGKPGGPVTGPYDPERMAFPYGLSVDSAGQLWVAARRWWVPKAIYVWKTDGTHVRNHYGPTMYGGGGTFDPTDPTRLLYHNGHGGVEFKVDWAAGTAEPVRIYQLCYGAVNDRHDLRPEFFQFSSGPGGSVAQPYRARGHRYITNNFAGPTSGPTVLMLLGDDDPKAGAPPRMLMGRAGTYEKQLERLGLLQGLEFTKSTHPGRRFSGAQKTLFLWTDLNRDGQPQAEEFQFHLPEILGGARADTGRFPDEWVMRGSGIITTVEFGENLEILVRSNSGRDRSGVLLRYRPTKVDPDGVPHYDLATYEVVLTEPHPQRNTSSNVLALSEGRLIETGGPIAGYRDGKLEWVYHSQWASLHMGHAAPRYPEYPGQLIATTRALGPAFAVPGGDAGELWALNSDRGLAYLFTADGLFVDTLFAYKKDGRSWNFPEHARGMDVRDVNYIDETFGPTITSFADGRVVMVVGKTHSSVVEVKGLDSIHRFVGEPIVVAPTDIARIHQHMRDLAMWDHQQADPGEILVPRVADAAAVEGGAAVEAEAALDGVAALPTRGAITVDGLLEEWGEPQWTVIQRARLGAGFGGRDVDYTTATLAYDATTLYVALRSRDRKVLDNEGGDLQNLFKTGGGLDLHLATGAGAEDRQEAAAAKDRKQPVEGDVRLLITRVGGETVAARYRPVVPGTAEPVIYHSAVAETRIDRVDDVSQDVRLAIQRVTLPDGKGEAQFEQIEVAIPLALLGWDPAALPETRGDIGILVGQDGMTRERIYWHNTATGIVSDTPSEARLEPAMWGPWKVAK